MFNLEAEKILVSRPEISFEINEVSRNVCMNSGPLTTFIFPTFPRPFKNLELVCKAVKILNQRKVENFSVLITISGTENLYSKRIYRRYRNLKNLFFIGRKQRSEIYEFYAKSDCLLFPSKLETWGLPISEFKLFDKPIFVSNLPYAHETLNGYDKAYLFDIFDEIKLADAMELFVLDSENFSYSQVGVTDKLFDEVNSWKSLFKTLIK
jgi:glycosyltransferase involved in cell wall biosynthesis